MFTFITPLPYDLCNDIKWKYFSIIKSFPASIYLGDQFTHFMTQDIPLPVRFFFFILKNMNGIYATEVPDGIGEFSQIDLLQLNFHIPQMPEMKSLPCLTFAKV